MPAKPEYVLISGEVDAVKELTDEWDNFDRISAKNIYYVTDADADPAPEMEVIASGEGYRIKDLKNRSVC